MPALARFHHLDSLQLDVGIQPMGGLGGVEPGTREGRPSKHPPRHAPAGVDGTPSIP